MPQRRLVPHHHSAGSTKKFTFNRRIRVPRFYVVRHLHCGADLILFKWWLLRPPLPLQGTLSHKSSTEKRRRKRDQCLPVADRAAAPPAAGAARGEREEVHEEARASPSQTHQARRKKPILPSTNRVLSQQPHEAGPPQPQHRPRQHPTHN